MSILPQLIAGDAPLEDLLGSFAAMSLGYDWVFVATQVGCTPAHVRLAGAADTAILGYAATEEFIYARLLDARRHSRPRATF